MRVIIACAGTGGHINPGIAIANLIKEKEPNSEILFIGTKFGMENDLVRKAGFEIKAIRTGKILRKLTLKNVKGIMEALKGIGDSMKILKEFKPDICIGTGGYICYPVMKAAIKLKIPYILHESNSYPGLSVKVLAKKAKAVLCGFEKTVENLKNIPNAIYTSTPCKISSEKFEELNKDKCKLDLKVPIDKKIVLVAFGSQGAKYLNIKMIDMILSAKNKDIFYVLITGTGNYDEVVSYVNKQNEINSIDTSKYLKIEKFVYEMDKMYKIADMSITRGGALTITELMATKLPAVLIPLPTATENHQYHNAMILENIDVAKVIEEKNLNIKELNDFVTNTLTSDSIEKMKLNYEKIKRHDVNEAIYKEIVK